MNNEKLSSIYNDLNKSKNFIRVCLGIGAAALVFLAIIIVYGIFFVP